MASLELTMQLLQAVEVKYDQSQSEATKLRQELTECSKSLDEVKSVHSTLKKKAVQLKGLYQQSTSELSQTKADLDATRLR